MEQALGADVTGGALESHAEKNGCCSVPDPVAPAVAAAAAASAVASFAGLCWTSPMHVLGNKSGGILRQTASRQRIMFHVIP